VRLHQAPDLGADHEAATIAPAQRGAKATLGQGVAVVRRGIEIADAQVPGRVDDGEGFFVAHRLVQAAELGAAQAKAA
jgi:hypothetical protein